VNQPRVLHSKNPTAVSDTGDMQLRKAGLIARLKRIEGQMRGIQEMIRREDSCENIARQLAAARAALDRSFYEMVACSIERELGSFVNPKAHAALEEASRILSKYG
jgi:DNA-binding FrmR family transcriptional regulator